MFNRCFYNGLSFVSVVHRRECSSHGTEYRHKVHRLPGKALTVLISVSEYCQWIEYKRTFYVICSKEVYMYFYFELSKNSYISISEAEI